MRKIITLILTLVFSMLFGTFIFAAAMEITSAKQSESGKVRVMCSLEGSGTRNITVVACEADAANLDYADERKIVYISQFDVKIVNNIIRFEFDPAEWMDENKTYIVKIYAEGIDGIAEMTVKSDGGVLDFSYGDANGDGKITATDAAMVYKKVIVNSEFLLPIEDKTYDFIFILDMDKDGKLTEDDVTWILEKVREH